MCTYDINNVVVNAVQYYMIIAICYNVKWLLDHELHRNGKHMLILFFKTNGFIFIFNTKDILIIFVAKQCAFSTVGFQ